MIYVVSGMCRTGTSMMMHALIRGGIPAIYDIGKSDARLLALKEMGYDSNHDGLFELYKSNLADRFPDDLDDELVKIQDQQWGGLIGHAENGIRVVYMLREKDSVLKSFKAFTGSASLTNIAERHDAQMDYIQQIKDRPDVVSVTMLQYEEVVNSPLQNLELLTRGGWPINAKKAAAVANPEYHHFRSKA